MGALLLLLGAGFLAGGMNALAGGGSFVSLPALIAAGIPPVIANASSTIALNPGGLASAWTYRALIGPVLGIGLRLLFPVTLAGGLAGSLLLLWTPSSAFDALLPWLLLAATLALAFARRIGEALRGALRPHPVPVLAVQFVLGVYGGYFGGAVGLMMLAVWSLLGETDVKALNGARTLLVTGANFAASVIFVLAGAVAWPQTLAMLLGGVAGGFAGARLGRILPARLTRILTLCTTALITAVFFVRTYATNG